MVSALTGALLLSGTSAMPSAYADDPLAEIISDITLYRSKTQCPRLTYNVALEEAAQRYARSERPEDGRTGNYHGVTAAFLGSGDPQASAVLSAYSRGARGAITDCGFTDFGVGFIRHDDRSVDVVTLVFGRQDEPVEPPTTPVSAPVSTPVTTPEPPKVAPTDAIHVSFDKGFQWTVNVTSTADIAGNCTYAATNPVLPGSNKTFNIGPRGSASFTVLAPPPFSTYHVVVSCSGTFEGKNVQFGHVEQDVSA